ncbi:MAG: hypothetical protein Q8K18_13375 [Burkholderiales bacterium]|nr:hypothetical protein [Burkholderiales bacterium]
MLVLIRWVVAVAAVAVAGIAAAQSCARRGPRATGTEESQPILPDELAQWMHKETVFWADIVRETGILAE